MSKLEETVVKENSLKQTGNLFRLKREAVLFLANRLVLGSGIINLRNSPTWDQESVILLHFIWEYKGLSYY